MANVFGALNRFISRLDSDSGVPQQSKPSAAGSNAYGFQVLRNNNTDLPLEPWFDFIIGINGRTIDNADHSLFATEVRNCAGSSISLGVYSVKGQVIREIYVGVPPDGSSLGVSLQWAPLGLGEDVWHILDVMPSSPADVAGLLPYSDYVIGSPDSQLHGEAALGNLIEQFMNRQLRLWVYNNEYDVTRLVTITPTKGWGGEGAMGCVLGYGALHRVPAPLNEPARQPGETLFESGENFTTPADAPTGAQEASQPEFLVPANMPQRDSGTSPPPPPSAGAPPMGKPRKQRAHHNTGPPAGLDDYFAEGEQKSREIDKPSTPKAGTGLPPPPKGGPPRGASPLAADGGES